MCKIHSLAGEINYLRDNHRPPLKSKSVKKCVKYTDGFFKSVKFTSQINLMMISEVGDSYLVTY